MQRYNGVLALYTVHAEKARKCAGLLRFACCISIIRHAPTWQKVARARTGHEMMTDKSLWLTTVAAVALSASAPAMAQESGSSQSLSLIHI